MRDTRSITYSLRIYSDYTNGFDGMAAKVAARVCVMHTKAITQIYTHRMGEWQ